MSKPLVYLAGPFFNPRQVDVIAHIESTCVSVGIDFFSPRQQHKINPGIKQPVPQIGNTAMAQEVFEGNFKEIERCTHMLAVLDFPLPEGEALALIRRKEREVVRELVLPDTGTIWEMGVAYALKRPTVGLKIGGHGYMNLMITQSMAGVINDGSELRNFLQGLLLGEMRVGEWKGSYR